MKKFHKSLSVVLATATLITTVMLSGCRSNTSASSGGDPGTITLGMSTWIGYAPLWVAEKKGFFKKEGVDVKITKIEDAGNLKTAFAANKVQGIAETADTFVMTAAAGIKLKQVLTLDTSDGGDGIVANKSIQSLQDLKGKTVALDTTGGASIFWFNYLLSRNGMTLKDMNVQNMEAGDAGSAFIGKKVDAAVTWQPWLSRVQNTDFGHVLVSSDSTPGIIVDLLGFSEDFTRQHPKAVQAVVNGWFDALDYCKTNPDDANKIMADAMGQSVSDYVALQPNVKLYDKPMNQQYFGTSSQKGDVYSVEQMASDLWYQMKLIQNKPNINSLLDGQFIK